MERSDRKLAKRGEGRLLGSQQRNSARTIRIVSFLIIRLNMRCDPEEWISQFSGMRMSRLGFPRGFLLSPRIPLCRSSKSPGRSRTDTRQGECPPQMTWVSLPSPSSDERPCFAQNRKPLRFHDSSGFPLPSRQASWGKQEGH
jgi:hypothetical protein